MGKILSSLMVALLGLTSFISPVWGQAKINRVGFDKITAASPLVLSLYNGTQGTAGHGSHISHGSHESHQSHYSSR